MLCDGCRREFESTGIGYTAALGHVMRYCQECMAVWTEFKAACEAESKRLNRLLDLWEKDTRSRLPLKLTPLDMPNLADAVRNANGTPIILG